MTTLVLYYCNGEGRGSIIPCLVEDRDLDSNWTRFMGITTSVLIIF